MNRVALALLEITNGTLTAATLELQKGLNVISGIENRGKTYAFKCLDFLLGAKKAPKHNKHSRGYTTATVYFTISGQQRGGVRREFESGKAQGLPLHAVDTDASSVAWYDLSKSSTAKSDSISSYWLEAFGVEPTLLRKNQSGSVSALSVRYLAHLVMVDELRILAESSTARTAQATGWTAEADFFAHMIGGRRNPPAAVVKKPKDSTLPTAVKEFILAEVERIDARLKALPVVEAGQDEADQIARKAQDFSAIANEAATSLQQSLVQIEEAQRGLMETRSKTKVSREIAVRLELLQEYYQTDLRRLEAVHETAFLLGQLNTVPCPTCLQPFTSSLNQAVGEDSSAYLDQIVTGSQAEAAKIRQLEADLSVTLARAKDDFDEASANEKELADSLERLRLAARTQQDLVEKSRSLLAATFTDLGPLAERRALRQRRAELIRQIPADNEPDTSLPTSKKTEFGTDAITGFCDTVKKLLEAWKWNYTDPPLTVTFDEATTDILISGEERDSFSKAVRAIISSAFIIGLMDYCYANDLPHPGFVVLDSPLTTKADRKEAEEEEDSDDEDESGLIGGEKVSDEILTAFFTHLARNYLDRQVIIIDNKEPPEYLEGEIKHIRFNDPPIATRQGLFPPKK